MELVECAALSLRDWVELTGRDHDAFGPVGARLAWRPKERYVVLRTPDGLMAAAGGLLQAGVEVDGAGPLEVVGIGGVIVAPRLRGRGLGATVMDELRRLSATMGPELSMIFCAPELEGLYRRRDWATITDPVWVDQPEGPIEMPMLTMWRPVRPGAQWPPGRVDVRGLPF